MSKYRNLEKSYLPWATCFWIYIYSSISIAAPTINLLVPQESMGPFISNATAKKSGLINQLIAPLENKTNLNVEIISLPTLRIIEKIAHKEINNWITFSTDGSVTLAGMKGISPVDATGKNAVIIPIAGFEIKLWTNRKYENRYSTVNSLRNKTVLITRNFHYAGFVKIQRELNFQQNSAPSLFSAVKMLISDRSDLLLASVPTILWNLESLELSQSDLYPVELPEHLKLFTNIFIMLDHNLPQDFLDSFTDHILHLEETGQLQAIRSSLHLQAPQGLSSYPAPFSN